MRVAIVGSRNYPIPKAIQEYVAQLPLDTVIISGAARGVDTIAALAARLRGLKTKLHIPDWNKHGKAAGYVRNKDIVADADIVVAFWDGKSKGTEHTMSLARQAGKPLIVYGVPVVPRIEVANLKNENCDYGSIIHWQDITI